MDSGLLHGRGRLATVDRDGAELRSVTIAGGEEHGAGIIGRETTARHPDASARGGVRNTVTLSGPSLNQITTRLVETNDPPGEVVLHTVGGETKVDELSDVQKGGALVMDTAVEGSDRVVPGHGALQVDGEVGSFGESVDIQCVDVVTSGWATLSDIDLGLVGIGLGGQVQGVSGRVNDTGGGDADVGVDVDAAVEVGGQEGNVKVARGDDGAGLCIKFVDIILLRRDVDVLCAVAAAGGVNERL